MITNKVDALATATAWVTIYATNANFENQNISEKKQFGNNQNTITAKNIVIMLKPHLQRKIDYSLSLIRRAEPIALQYQDYGIVVAISGGKDSTVLAHLVEMAGVRHRLEHNLTTVDAPETVYYVKNTYPGIIINRPEKNFWQICEHAGILPNQNCRFCCQKLKERTGALTVTCTGVRHSESFRRKQREEVEILTRRRHPDYTKGTFDQFDEHREVESTCIRGKDKLIVNPILEWTETDVWDFIRHYNLPYNPLYDEGFRRVGCVLCPMASTKEIWREVKRFPRYYQNYLRMIKRIYDAREEKGQNDTWRGLTPEQIFAWHASKKSMAQFRAELNAPKINFAEQHSGVAE